MPDGLSSRQITQRLSADAHPACNCKCACSWLAVLPFFFHTVLMTKMSHGNGLAGTCHMQNIHHLHNAYGMRLH